MRTIALTLIIAAIAVEGFAQDAVPRGRKAEGGGLSMTVHSHAKAHNIGYTQAAMGNILVIVDVTIEGMAESQYVSILDFQLRDNSGALYRLQFVSLADQWASGDIARGQRRRGKMVFEVPDRARGLEILHRRAFIASRI